MVFFLYFSIAGKVDQHVLNAKAFEFIPRFTTTSGFGTDKVAKRERGYVLYLISIAHLGRYSFMRELTGRDIILQRRVLVNHTKSSSVLWDLPPTMYM